MCQKLIRIRRSMSKKSKWPRTLRIAFIVLGVPFAVVGLLCLLFVVNGVLLADGEKPRTGLTGHPPKHLNTGSGETYLKVMSYNIAKAFVHKGGILFESPEAVKTRIERIDLFFRMAVLAKKHKIVLSRVIARTIFLW